MQPAEVKAQPPANPAAPSEPRRVQSEHLLGPGGQTIIVHRGREYLLRQTQNGKLILTA